MPKLKVKELIDTAQELLLQLEWTKLSPKTRQTYDRLQALVNEALDNGVAL